MVSPLVHAVLKKLQKNSTVIAKVAVDFSQCTGLANSRINVSVSISIWHKPSFYTWKSMSRSSHGTLRTSSMPQRVFQMIHEQEFWTGKMNLLFLTNKIRTAYMPDVSIISKPRPNHTPACWPPSSQDFTSLDSTFASLRFTFHARDFRLDPAESQRIHHCGSHENKFS